ncbi:hypothetical protein D9M68_970840 [compost metagenome]
MQEEAEKGVPAPYTQERGQVLLRQYPELYWFVLQTGADIAHRIKEKTQETVGKS